MLTKQNLIEIFGIDGWAKLLTTFSETTAPAEPETSEQEETKETQLATAELEDGTKVILEVDEQGKERLFVVVSEGDNAPAPEGTHITTEGTYIVTDNEGYVLEKGNAADLKAEAPDPTEAKVEELKKKIEEMSAQAADYQNQLIEEQKKREQMQADNAAMFAKFAKAIDSIAAEKSPAKPIKQDEPKAKAWFANNK